MPKMAGPFVPLPKEVIDLFDTEPGASLAYYVKMLSKCYLEIVEETGTQWVGALVHHSQRDITKKLGGSQHIRYRLIPRWVKVGVLEIQPDGSIFLPMYYKKSDAYIQPLKMQKEINNLKEVFGVQQVKQTEMENTITNLLDLLSNRRVDHTSPRARSGLATRAAGSLYSIDLKRSSLSVMNKVISIFHSGIGQKQISGSVRGNSIKVFQKLEKEGFTPYQIALAVDWTIIPENVSAKIRSFGIIATTISQAIAAMEQAEEKELQAEEVVQLEAAKKSGQLDEAAERERLDQVRESMPAKELTDLKAAALAELDNLGIYDKGMISQVLITIQENQILRKREIDAVKTTGSGSSGD